MSRFRAGAIRAYVDIQVPGGAEESVVREQVERVARGFRASRRWTKLLNSAAP